MNALDPKALEAAYAAVDALPLRDFEHIGGELDKLRSHEGARAAIIAYRAASTGRETREAVIDECANLAEEVAMRIANPKIVAQDERARAGAAVAKELAASIRALANNGDGDV